MSNRPTICHRKKLLGNLKCGFETGKRGQKTELTGRSPLRKRRSALDCSAVEEEEDDDDPIFQSYFQHQKTIRVSRQAGNRRLHKLADRSIPLQKP
jgi:hypothetical protein